MSTTIKAQIAAYKWIIIISLIGLLTIGLGWQYHRASMLENTVTTVKTKNEQLEKNIQTTTRQFNEYRETTDKALADLDTLRDSIAEISGQTAELQGKVNNLKRTPVAPEGANANQLEDQANTVTRDVFNRIQNASRGKTK
jgi:uncharacterized coiled-coil DUF342 family protein